MSTVLLLDGNALMHRAYHGMAKGHFLPVWNNMPVGMVYGFASTIINACEVFRPDFFVATFDTPEPTYRHKMCPEYKAQRAKAPDDFYPQLPLVEEFLEAYHLPILKSPGYEADDIIGTLARQAESKGHKVLILSGDLDFLQLVDNNIRLMKFNGNLKDSISYGPEETMARLGVTPQQVIDYKAIVGDTSDNYKGIPGIGPKGATTLLQEYKTLQGIYDHLDALPQKVHEKFKAAKEEAFFCQHMAQIQLDVPTDFQFIQDNIFQPSTETPKEFFQKMGFPSLERRFESMNKKIAQEEEKSKKEQQEKELAEQQTTLF